MIPLPPSVDIACTFGTVADSAQHCYVDSAVPAKLVLRSLRGRPGFLGAELHTDHKALTSKIERMMHDLHAMAKEAKETGEPVKKQPRSEEDPAASDGEKFPPADASPPYPLMASEW